MMTQLETMSYSVETLIRVHEVLKAQQQEIARKNCNKINYAHKYLPKYISEPQGTLK